MTSFVQTLSSIELDEDLMEVYKTDPLRYHRSLVIYLNELSLSDQTSQVSLFFLEDFLHSLIETHIQYFIFSKIRFVWS